MTVKEKELLEKIEFTARVLSYQLSILIGITLGSLLFK